LHLPRDCKLANCKTGEKQAGGLAIILPEEPAERKMSTDTIYLRQILDLEQVVLRERIGVNLADVRQLQDKLMDKAEKFNMGIIPENEAADFARETGKKTLEYEIHAKEELERLQEEQKKPVQHSPEVEKFLNGLSEEKRNLLQSESDRVSQLPISSLENLIAELKRLREIAWCLTAHIQDYAETPEYRERRRAFFAHRGSPAGTCPGHASAGIRPNQTGEGRRHSPTVRREKTGLYRRWCYRFFNKRKTTYRSKMPNRNRNVLFR
jgi:hypothetical protein